MSKTNNTPIIISAPSSTGSLIIGGIVLLVGGYFAKKAYDKYLQDQLTKTTGTDANANLARQINAEVTAYPTNDDTVVRLFKQVIDFKEVARYYRLLSGKDILEDVKANVGATAYRQILNLLGYSSGTFKPQSQQAQAVKTKAGLFLVAKADTYLRKTPLIPVCSRFVPDELCYRENVITPIKSGEYIGISTTGNLSKQNDLIDKKSGVVFIEVLVTDTKGRTYNAYVAASRISTYSKYNKGWKWRKFTPLQYQNAKAPLNGFNSLI